MIKSKSGFGQQKKTLVDYIKQCDFFQYIPQDLTAPTFTGSLLTFFLFGAIGILLLQQLTQFYSVNTTSEMHVDVEVSSSKDIQTNIDILFMEAPCHLLSLDGEDIMGNFDLDIQGSLLKYRVQQGKHEVVLFEPQEEYDLDDVQMAIQQKEGCKINGTFWIHKVPGQFHISTHSQRSLATGLEIAGIKIDYSHQILHLSFGDPQEQKYVLNHFDKGLQLNPIDGTITIAPKDIQRNHFMAAAYFLDVTPARYNDLHNHTFQAYQYALTHTLNFDHGEPKVVFRYELSPLNVVYRQEVMESSTFLVNLCAIVGGIVTVAGLLESLIVTTVEGRMHQKQY